MGGGGNKKGGTPAPNFSQAAMVNQTNPFGSVSWSGGGRGGGGGGGAPMDVNQVLNHPGGMWQGMAEYGGVGSNEPLSMDTSFSGPMQGVFNNVVAGMNSASSMDPAKARDQAVNQNLDYGMSRLNPLMAQQNNAFNASMANSGLDPGSQAYNAANQQLGVRQSDMFNTVYNTALNAGNETQRTQMAQAMQPFAQAGMMQNWLPHGNPNAPLAAAGLQYEAGKDATSAQQGKKGSAMGGLGSIAGTLLGGPLGGMVGGAAGNALGDLANPASMALGGRGYDDNLGGYNF